MAEEVDAKATEDGAKNMENSEVKCVMLDIEGTICPISFVKDTLFRYALSALPSVLATQWNSPTFTTYRDAFPEQHRTSPAALQAHIEQLTRDDVKVAAHKNLQGYLWRDGYETGAYATPLFADVAKCLKEWKGQGMRLGIYSSGSVFAQKLLFGHVGVEGKPFEDGRERGEKKEMTTAPGEKRSIDDASASVDAAAGQPPSKKVAADASAEDKAEVREGGEATTAETVSAKASIEKNVATEDLQYLISDWFDTTNAGPKKEESSYTKIADELKLAPSDILFLTDSVEEYDAATAAGFRVGLIVRPGNPPLSEENREKYRVMRSLEEVDLHR